MTKANVMVYPVDVAKGCPSIDMWDISQPESLYIHPELKHLVRTPTARHGAAEGRDGMKEMASRTGGKSCTAGNNIKVCLDQALSESSDYYLLGFYVSQQHARPGWHKLKVTVNAGQGEVRSRNSYFLRALGTPPRTRAGRRFAQCHPGARSTTRASSSPWNRVRRPLHPALHPF